MEVYLVVLVLVSIGVVPEVDIGHAGLQDVTPDAVGNEVIATVPHQFPEHFATGYLVVSSVQHTSLHAPNKILFLFVFRIYVWVCGCVGVGVGVGG